MTFNVPALVLMTIFCKKRMKADPTIFSLWNYSLFTNWAFCIENNGVLIFFIIVSKKSFIFLFPKIK